MAVSMVVGQYHQLLYGGQNRALREREEEEEAYFAYVRARLIAFIEDENTRQQKENRKEELWQEMMRIMPTNS